jgi:hypothetical protein
VATPSRTEAEVELAGAPDGPDLVGLGEQATALEALTARADAQERAARSPRTRTLYAADWAHFTDWCRLTGPPPLPADVDIVRLYLTDLEATRVPDGTRVYQPATLARRLAAIAAAHRDGGCLSTTRDPRVRVVLSGIRHGRKHASRRMRPLLLAELRTIFSGMDYSSWPVGVSAARDTFAQQDQPRSTRELSRLAHTCVSTSHADDDLLWRARGHAVGRDVGGEHLDVSGGRMSTSTRSPTFLSTTCPRG